MKKIEAVFRVEKLEEVTSALDGVGYPGIMISHIEGHGRQKGIIEQFRGREYKVSFIPKIKLEMIVKDEDVDMVASIIIKAAKTGEIGDGKIFVYPAENAIRIRTEEKGDVAI